ncbi:Tyrosinase [Smittium mucronatum]|uniref:Tyrosinase n=1 Tax=Smittium mucronatum TaxID=133383 RepID=A0A1R0GSB3_9FUNG|nr:Tyrosinase [Smittium mucronatum]
MKISAIYVSFMLGLTVLGQNNFGANQSQPDINSLPRCSSVYTRRDIKTFSDGEMSNLSRLLGIMRDNGWFTWFARVHTENFNTIHGRSMFMPFHRIFIHDFERIMRTYDSNFALPYYNSPQDFSNPSGSSLFSSRMFGGNGSGPNRCLADGIQGGWMINYPSNQCLNRAFNAGNSIQPWYNPPYIESLVQRSRSFDEFRSELEYSQHGSVHTGIGGTMEAMESPNDFFFFLHHSYIDLVWWRFQTANPANMMSYNGGSSINDRIINYNIPVSDVMQLGYGPMCYQYDSSQLRKSGKLIDNKVEAGLRNLNPTIVSKYFPLFAQSESTVSKNMLSNSSGTSTNGTILKMAYPNEPDPMWIKMHGYNMETAIKVRNNAISMIDDLHAAGFSNPY